MVNGEGVSRAMKVDAGFEASARWMPSILDSLTIFIQRIPTVPFNWHVRSEDESSESITSGSYEKNLFGTKFLKIYLSAITVTERVISR